VLVLAALFLGLPAPASAASLAAFVAALLGALLLGAAMLTTLTVSFFWTVSGQGISQLHAAAFFLFSGMTVPLPLMPEWMQPALALQPYRAFSDAPFRLYLGHLGPDEVGPVLAHQLGWTLLVVLLGRGMMSRARRQLVVQGG
jgi:ABC-2 type transport system permease protein